MPGGLTPNPRSIDFGNVVTGDSFEIDMTLTNNSDQEGDQIGVNSITCSDPQFTVAGFTSGIIWPVGSGLGPSTVTCQVTFTPTGTGVTNATLTVSSDSVNNPLVVPLTGNGITSGRYLSASPSSFVFPTTKVGLTSAGQAFTITNTGTMSVTISGFTLGADFSSTLPTTPITLTVGTSQIVTIAFAPTVTGYITESLSVASNAVGTPLIIALSGLSVPITPAYIATGQIQAVAGLFGAGQVAVDKFSATDLDTEEPGQAYRWHDFGKPGLPKNYDGLFIIYEDLGAATLTVTARTHKDSKSIAVTLGDNASDDLMDVSALLYVPFSSYMEIRMNRSAAGGPISIVELIHQYETGLQQGTVQLPSTITPAYIATGHWQAVAAFGSVVDVFSSTDFNTEEDCKATRTRNIHGLGIEDTVNRVEVFYEDLAAVTATVLITNYERNQSQTQDNTFGGSGDTNVRSVLFDLAGPSGELLTMLLTRLAGNGPLSMTAHGWWTTERGEKTK